MKMDIIAQILLAILLTTTAQQLDIQDLTNNNGYIPIKIREQKTISHYSKVLHFINLTTYDETTFLIASNIKALTAANFEDKQLLNTVNKNFLLLKAKISYLHPHTKTKRGLVNIIGKGLKYIAGTMDSDDEQQIINILDTMNSNAQYTADNVNKLIYANKFLTDQINNITKHINKQQTLIQNYINLFRETTQNKIKTIEDELEFMKHIYQVNNDITLLQSHINDIGQVIFSSKLGIIPTDILTQTELDLINEFDSYNSIQVAVIFQNENIIITLLIPQFSSNILSKVQFEPIPNVSNMSLILNEYEILTDDNNNVYNKNVKDNREKYLIPLEDSCIINILKFEEANCKLKPLFESTVTEVLPGILIFKNFNSSISHNCNKSKIKQKGTSLIKFENWEVIAANKTYENIKLKMYDTFVLPNKITKIKENLNVTAAELKLENLYVNQLEQGKHIELLLKQNKKVHLISLSSDLIIVFVITTIILIVILINKYKRKLYISPELQSSQNTAKETTGPFLQLRIT